MNCRRYGSVPGLGRSPGGGNGNPSQYSGLDNSMDGGAWWATVHGVTKSRTRLRLSIAYHNKVNVLNATYLYTQEWLWWQVLCHMCILQFFYSKTRPLIFSLKYVSEVASHVWLFTTSWTVAHQAPQSLAFSRHWSGLPFPSPGDLPNQGIEPGSPAL